MLKFIALPWNSQLIIFILELCLNIMWISPKPRTYSRVPNKISQRLTVQWRKVPNKWVNYSVALTFQWAMIITLKRTKRQEWLPRQLVKIWYRLRLRCGGRVRKRAMPSTKSRLRTSNIRLILNITKIKLLKSYLWSFRNRGSRTTSNLWVETLTKIEIIKQLINWTLNQSIKASHHSKIHWLTMKWRGSWERSAKNCLTEVH